VHQRCANPIVVELTERNAKSNRDRAPTVDAALAGVHATNAATAAAHRGGIVAAADRQGILNY